MSNWKRFERRVAAKFGGERIPITGRKELDIRHPTYGIECKYRKSLPAWLFKHAVGQAVTGSAKSGKIPVVVLGEYNKSDMYVIAKIEDFVRATRQPLTPENKVGRLSSDSLLQFADTSDDDHLAES